MAPAKNVTGSGFKPSSEPAQATPSQTTPTQARTAVDEENAPPTISEEDGIVRVLLHRFRNTPLGINIEGGSDTPLQYVYVKSLSLGSPASNSGALTKGDQIVMVGEECLIGKTHQEAISVLEKAPSSVEIVAQRKPKEEERTENEGKAMLQESLLTASHDNLLQSKEDLRGSRQELYLSTSVPEEMITIDLVRQPGEKLGLGVVGGSEHPSLKDVHVRTLIPV